MGLLKEIEQNNVRDGAVHIYFLGQSGYVFKTKHTIIYIDPYLSDYVEHSDGLNEVSMKRNYSPPIFPVDIQQLDAVLSTHSHGDHMDPWTIQEINAEFTFYSSIGAYEKSPVDIRSDKIIFLEPGKPEKINEITIQSICAAHYNLYDEKGRPDCLSFIISCNNKTFFFWGDGILYEGLEEKLQPYTFDYFFAPVNGRDKYREDRGIIGNINAKEVAELCCKLNVKSLVPNHIDMFNNNSVSIGTFFECMNDICPSQNVIIMNCGDKIEV